MDLNPTAAGVVDSSPDECHDPDGVREAAIGGVLAYYTNPDPDPAFTDCSEEAFVEEWFLDFGYFEGFVEVARHWSSRAPAPSGPIPTATNRTYSNWNSRTAARRTAGDPAPGEHVHRDGAKRAL